MLPKVFDQFVQERQTLDRSAGGLGLGLSIVRSLVNLHGDTVDAHSRGLGDGSEFRVLLPLCTGPGEPAAKRPQPATSGTPKGVRVLLVDDNLDAATLPGRVLSVWGHLVCVAHDGSSALEIVEHLHSRRGVARHRPAGHGRLRARAASARYPLSPPCVWWR